jgi:ABC-2 type transport system ATP-binding protein
VGRREIRDLMTSLKGEGKTLFINSHLLGEVEAVADQLLVIDRGKLVAQGAKQELLAAAGVIVRALDTAELHEALAEAGLTATPGADGALLVEAQAEDVGRVAAANGIVLLELRPADTGGLERLFLSLTREEALVA